MRWSSLKATLGAVLIIATSASLASSAPIRLDAGFGSNTLPRNDDGSTGAVALGFSLNFFGSAHNSVFVNNNGNLTFVTGLGTFTPFGLTANTNTEIIAPFFADVDTRALASGVVTYGQASIDGRPAFGANYRDVGYYPSSADKTNDFQVVLLDRSDVGAGDFDIEFNYGRIQWETGGASGGSNGLGGSSARAGYSRGSGVPGTFFELPGSGINGAFLDDGTNALASGSFGTGEPGRYVFEVRNGQASIPGLTPNNPFLPNSSAPGEPGQPPVFFFGNVPGGRWFDPPLVSSYTYTATGGTLFTGAQFPAGFGDAFDLAAIGCALAGPYPSSLFIDFTSVCGGVGISQFTVSGISPLADAGDPQGFPTYLTFNGATGSFTMQGNASAVPEPGTLLVTLLGAAAVFGRSRNRRNV